MAFGRGKKLEAHKYPLHNPQTMTKPRLALILIPLIFLSSSLVPSYALYFLITVLYMHHNPLISDLSFYSWKPGYMLFLELFDTVLMKSTKIHSSLQTLTHNLTPPLCKNYPINIPIIPIVSEFHPYSSCLIYIPLETHRPTKATEAILKLIMLRIGSQWRSRRTGVIRQNLRSFFDNYLSMRILY